MTDSKVEVQIPFAGTYNTIWDSLIDSEMEQEVDYRARGCDGEFPDQLMNDQQASDYRDYLFNHLKFKEAFTRLAEEYADHFRLLLAEKLYGAPVRRRSGTDEVEGFKFLRMWSPREYNFETDVIYCGISLAILERAYALPEVQARLPAAVKERCTSRSGFVSFYSNDLSQGQWAKPREEWDSVQWGLVLSCLWENEEEYHEWEMEVYEHMAGNNQFLEIGDLPEKWQDNRKKVSP